MWEEDFKGKSTKDTPISEFREGDSSEQMLGILERNNSNLLTSVVVMLTASTP